MIIKLYNVQEDSIAGQRAPNYMELEKGIKGNIIYGSPQCDIIENASNVTYQVLEKSEELNDNLIMGYKKWVDVRYTDSLTKEILHGTATVRAIICTDEGKTVEVINL